MQAAVTTGINEAADVKEVYASAVVAKEAAAVKEALAQEPPEWPLEVSFLSMETPEVTEDKAAAAWEARETKEFWDAEAMPRVPQCLFPVLFPVLSSS